jgi:glucose-1-phosphatase
MIKAIIFDLSGVLFTNGLKIGLEKIHQKYKLNKDDIEELVDGQSANDYRLYNITPEQFWQNLQDQLFLTDEEKEDFKKIWFESYELIPEMLRVVDELKEKGLQVYYLSDNPPDRAPFLDKKYNFIKHFDGGIFSFEAKARKPSKEIFEQLLERIDLKKDEVLYLDDKESNLKPAEELGLKIYHFATLEQFKKDLERGYDISLR